MRTIILLLLLTITAHHVNAQPDNQSLFETWRDTSKSDSIRTSALRNYINKNYLYTTSDSAVILATALESFGKKQGYAIAEAMGAHIQGLSWHVRGDYPQALRNYERSLEIGEANELFSGVSKTLNNIGVIYTDQGAYTKALEYHIRSLAIKETLGSQKGIANSLNSIGNIYGYQGDFPKALEYFTRSLEIAESMGDELLTAGFINNIGFIYERQGNTEKALEYFTNSLALHEKVKSKKGIALSKGNIGNILVILKHFDEALDAFFESLKISESLGDQKRIANIYNNIGTIYQIQNKNAKALTYCSKGYTLSSSLGLLKYMKDGCLCLYEVYKDLGDSDKALEYHEALKGIDDSLALEETTKSLQRMEFQNVMLKDSITQAEISRAKELEHQIEIEERDRVVKYTAASGSFLLLLVFGLYSRMRYIRKSKSALQTEKDRSENLLLNILPSEIAEELKVHGEAQARSYDHVSILFTDFKDFTKASEKLSPTELVTEINTYFKAFDEIIGKYNIEKIKTIGDAYMAAGGLPVPTAESVKNTVLAALEMQALIAAIKLRNEAVHKPSFEMRAGIHTGPVVAGIVGAKKFQYDIWGDSVNTASRMESSGEIGRVNISKSTYELLKDHPEFNFSARGKVEAKGKGSVEMWFVSKKENPSLDQ